MPSQLHRKTRSVAKPAKRKNAPLKKRSTRMNDETRWAAVQRRDAAFDGEFVYAVRTTGVYCKPSCASRRALRKNVSFFDSTAAAEHAGFRACQRCKPNVDRKPLINTVVHELARAIDADPLEPARLE